MASRPKKAEPRPQPRLYLLTPHLAETAGFAAPLNAALAAADVAAVLLRLADADERSLINRAKALAPLVQSKGAALISTAMPIWWRAPAPTALTSPASPISPRRSNS